MPNKIKIALAGNPNSGKSSLFNKLTGAHARVGNFPGITVSKKEATIRRQGREIHIVDLPGTYSLTAYSPEELVARNYILDERPDLVVVVVDAANLERNLYLAVQMMEIGVPIVLALNMMDVAIARGLKIDHEKLGDLLEVRVAPTVARSNQGLDRLMDAVIETGANSHEWRPHEISYGADLDEPIAEIVRILSEDEVNTARYPLRWMAIKILEQDSQLKEMIAKDDRIGPRITRLVDRVSSHIRSTMDEEPEGIISDYRYGYIASVVKQSVSSELEVRRTVSDMTDKFLLNRLLGPVFLLVIVYAIYQFVFSVSKPLVAVFGSFFEWFGKAAEALIPEGLLQSLVVSGIIDGVGGVLGFVPLIFFMFFAIAILEDSGYIARVAFIMDRVLRTFGLHGNSVLSLIVSGGISGGCAVPGVMAARTLRDPKERLATILVTPLMNCGAKLPVYAMLIAAFFTKYEAQMMFILTLIAWAMALLAARILRWTVLRGSHTPFVMELPPYRLPTLNGLLIHTWERTWQYIKKAGTIILGISILIWAMMTFPGLPGDIKAAFDTQRVQLTETFLAEPARGVIADQDALAVFQSYRIDYEDGVSPDAGEAGGRFPDLARAIALLERGESLSAGLAGYRAAAQGYLDWSRDVNLVDAEEARTALMHSLGGRLGDLLQYVTDPLGFDWRVNIALVGGFAAKEVILSTLGTAYSLGEIDIEESEPLSAKLARAPGWNTLSGFTLLLFIMISAPCFVTLITIGRETRSLKWPLFALVYTTIMAYIICLIVAQGGRVLGLGM
ncbi:MAG: ferrous iron transport protein B [Deltaproteobacteria bacterium]|nr:ferrous iron transport protein B [Deltaproteobacteria bacterium]